MTTVLRSFAAPTGGLSLGSKGAPRSLPLVRSSSVSWPASVAATTDTFRSTADPHLCPDSDDETGDAGTTRSGIGLRTG